MDKCYVIPVQKMCNADCLFCISKTRDYDKEEEILILTAPYLLVR